MSEPTTHSSFALDLDEAGLERLGDLLAFELRPGDWVALAGDLGAGKTTLARAIIRAALVEAEAEVPSPTFSLIQTYDAPRTAIAHLDLYRLGSADETTELGIDEALVRGAVLVEWPERAPALAPSDRLEIALTEIDAGARRHLTATGHGCWAPRLARLAAIHRFINAAGWSSARARPIPGDASSRRYLRLDRDGTLAILMDMPRQPDGPPIRDGKPYSRIAHLAEDCRPFVAVARHLSSLGLAAPAILAQDLDAGLVLLEDLGDRVFQQEVVAGADQLALWRAAVHALVSLRRPADALTLPTGDGGTHEVPGYDRDAMRIEVELLTDWYCPAVLGAPVDSVARAAFIAAWDEVFDRILAEPTALVLRDFHSPNLMWRPEREGLARVGIIDFQDALIGHPAYDLVSLLQDARVDTPEEIERTLLAEYEAAVAAREPAFDVDRFELAYRALGAQRNTKILGIFVRLARRDGKPRYLAHIPRIWRYLERDLAHEGLKELRGWYDRVLPRELRQRVLTG